MSDHQQIERQVAVMHRVVADRLRAGDSSPLARAYANLSRWQRQFGGELPTAYAEWVAILDEGLEAVLEVLEGSSQRAIRLRSSSPFAGVLTASERWEILKGAA